MAGLKEIRDRINTVKTTMQVTSAMKMVSAAKLKKAQNNLLNSRPYTDKLSTLLSHLLLDEETRKDFPYLQTSFDEDKILFIIVTSNRGLCGAFNSSTIKMVIEELKTSYSKSSKVDFISIGKQGGKLLKSRQINVMDHKDEFFEDLTFETVESFSKQLTEEYLNKKYDKIAFVYTKFISAGRLEVSFENFLPIVPDVDEDQKNLLANYIYEPDKTTILYDIIPKALQMHTYMVLLNSFTSEHAARMQAMQQATDNAQTLLKDLTLSYNKARQTTITNEILEITSGAEALQSK